NGAPAGTNLPADNPAVSDAIVYVSPNGSDSNDGRSWGSAKATILAAYEGLPASGGTIYIAGGSYVGGTIANQGIWIVGPNDPSYSSPLPGWKKEKSVRFVGVGASAYIQFGIGNAVQINGGQPGKGGWVLARTKPFIWLAGTNTGIWFDNLAASSPAVGIRLGVSADQSSRNINTALIWFRNVNVQVQNNGGGPVLDIGYAFWLFFENCVFIGAYNDNNGHPLSLQ